jgi:hypothetical protein
VRPEGLGKLKKKFNDLICNRTRYLPACSIEPIRRWENPIIKIRSPAPPTHDPITTYKSGEERKKNVAKISSRANIREDIVGRS